MTTCFRQRRSAARLLVAAVLVTLIAVDMRAFTFPPSDPPLRTDLVVVLGPWTNGPRLAVARDLAGRGEGRTPVLVSVNDVSHDCGVIQRSLTSAEVTCFRPRPFTTRGEARGAAAFARTRGLRSVTVVTSPDQLVRAGVRFRRCHSNEVRLVVAPTPLLDRLALLPYQNAAMVKALVFERAC